MSAPFSLHLWAGLVCLGMLVPAPSWARPRKEPMKTSAFNRESWISRVPQMLRPSADHVPKAEDPVIVAVDIRLSTAVEQATEGRLRQSVLDTLNSDRQFLIVHPEELSNYWVDKDTHKIGGGKSLLDDMRANLGVDIWVSVEAGFDVSWTELLTQGKRSQVDAFFWRHTLRPTENGKEFPFSLEVPVGDMNGAFDRAMASLVQTIKGEVLPALTVRADWMKTYEADEARFFWGREAFYPKKWSSPAAVSTTTVRAADLMARPASELKLTEEGVTLSTAPLTERDARDKARRDRTERRVRRWSRRTENAVAVYDFFRVAPSTVPVKANESPRQ